MVVEQHSLDKLSAEQLREVAVRLMGQLRHQSALLEKLSYENALLKRMKFAARSERFNAEQRSLLEDEIDADLAAVADAIDALNTQKASTPQTKQQTKRQPLPAILPRREIRHEPDSTTCQCGCQMKRIGEDVAEKLDYVPGVFGVERHVRGKWACSQCETIVQAPVAAHVIDKGIPTAGLLAQVLVAKYADHMPLYRQETSLAALGWPSRAPPWRSGSELAEFAYSLWSVPRPRYCNAAYYMRMKHRCRCSNRAMAKHTGLTCGPTHLVSLKT